MTEPRRGVSDESETLPGFGSVRHGRGRHALVPALTVLWHPRVDRIGDVCRLGALGHAEIAVSRREPWFASPRGERAPEALGDRGISRAPHKLFALASGELCLVPPEGAGTVRFRVDGLGLDDAGARFDAERVEAGAVLEIADRVALLLHLLPADQIPLAPFGLAGESPALQRLRAHIEQLRELGVPVLLRGESGTGKELVARAIHDTSARSKQPFLAVNIATIPTSLVASELFGHVRGAFTGAKDDSPGLFRRADGGTLLLDEVGDAPPEVQLGLLRAVETGEVLPVGGHAPVRVDVRLIAATDADLEERVREGSFRKALYHRLGSYQIQLAPLRERRDDLGRLLVRFLREELEQVGELERLERIDLDEPPWIPASVIARLVRYDWPGNVRELRNVARQLVIHNRGSARFELPPLVEQLIGGRRTSVAPPPPATGRSASAPPADGARSGDGAARRRRRPAEIGEAELVAALEAQDWRIGATARHLGISRNSLLGLMDRFPSLRRPKDLGAEQIHAVEARCAGDLGRMATELRVSERGLLLRMRELGLKK
jgi:two-component system nitrogen regulation response regulator GlnG